MAIISTDGGTVTENRYLWCGERVCQRRNINDGVTRRYYPEGQYNPNYQNYSKMYYSRDRLGSVRDVVSGGNGASVASYDYNAYGLPLNVPQSNAVDFGYAGMFYLPEAGLYLTHYRAYNPFIGNWLNRDPIGEEGGINLYSYVGGNPVNFVDPFGLEAHHVFPRQFWEKSQMSSDVKNFFDKRTINTPGRHGWSRAHADYNRRSGDLFDNFCERNNINDPNNINKDQAEQFMDELEADPDIQNFNEAMKNGTKPTPFNFDPITTIITCLIWPEACDGK